MKDESGVAEFLILQEVSSFPNLRKKILLLLLQGKDFSHVTVTTGACLSIYAPPIYYKGRTSLMFVPSLCLGETGVSNYWSEEFLATLGY